MICALFRNRIARCQRLPISTFRIQPRTSIASQILPFRCYATKTPSTRPPKPPGQHNAPSPSSQPNARAPPPVGERTRQLRRIELAERLFDAGDTTLYKASSRITSFRVTSWGLTSLCLLGIYYFNTNKLLNIDFYHEIGHEHPNLMIFAFGATAFFLAAAASWSFTRSWSHIDNIQLVRGSEGILMQVTRRSPVPFMQTISTIRPQDLIVDSNYVGMMQLPTSLLPDAPSEASPGDFTLGIVRESMKFVSRFFYQFFDAFRTFFSREGIISIDVIEDKKGQMKTAEYYMDAGGLYLQQNDKIVLWDLVEVKQPDRSP